MKLTRITFNPAVMGGKPCIRGLRVTVGMIVGLVASGKSPAQILAAYPNFVEPDISGALYHVAWHNEESETPIIAATGL